MAKAGHDIASLRVYAVHESSPAKLIVSPTVGSIVTATPLCAAVQRYDVVSHLRRPRSIEISHTLVMTNEELPDWSHIPSAVGANVRVRCKDAKVGRKWDVESQVVLGNMFRPDNESVPCSNFCL